MRIPRFFQKSPVDPPPSSSPASSTLPPLPPPSAPAPDPVPQPPASSPTPPPTPAPTAAPGPPSAPIPESVPPSPAPQPVPQPVPQPNPTIPSPPAEPPSPASAPAYYGGHPQGYSSYGEPQSDAGPLNSLDPLRLLQIMRQKWLTILLAVLFTTGAAIFYLSKATRIYRAMATIELSVRRPRILKNQAALIEDPSSLMQFENTLNTQIQKFKSKTLIPHVVACYQELFPEDPMSEEELTMHLGRGAQFSMVRRTRLVLVSFMSSNPDFAVRACNAFAAGAEASARAENQSVSDAAVAWLKAQGKVQKKSLGMADKKLLDARQKYQMDVLEGQRKTIQSSLLSFNDSLTQIESKSALEQKLLDALSVVELDPEGAGDLPVDIPRATDVEVSLSRWHAAVAEREALLSRYTPKHPSVEAQDRSVELYRKQARAALGRAKRTTAANLALYHEQIKSLRKKKKAQLKLASELEGDILNGEMKIASLERTRSAADASYLGLLFRIQEARLSADENTATVKLVDGASSVSKVQPRSMRILFMALMMGLMGGFGLAFLTDMIEDHVVGASDIETGTGIKILAIIPHVKAQSRREIATASLTHKFGEMAEAFAGLRSVLDSSIYSGQTKVILVASSLPEEGKTTTCCNLATACALNGQRTLLIDFDMRRPRVGKIFPMPSHHRGLMEYLASDAPRPQEIVYPSECRNMSVIASRVMGHARPAELVGGRRVADLLTWARATFDRVIIDAPPLGLVSDALSLAGLADCVLVMARPVTSRKRAVRHTIRRFHEVGISNIAVVMNDVDHSKFAYHGYGPYYHYRKHYGSYLEAPPVGATQEPPPQKENS